jgi:hypothetical protein
MLSNTFSLIQRQFEAQYIVTTTIRHKGEKGRQREHGLAALLREHLPLAYGVATGEIMPYIGDDHSPQCDIIIYDHLHYPILGKNDAVQLVPLEAVYCVIEAKSTITKTELVDAEKKFNKIRAMPRCSPKSKLKKGMRREPCFVVFGYSLGTPQTTVETMIGNDKQGYLVVALDSGIGCTVGEGKARKEAWVSFDDDLILRYSTLALFYCMLLSVMQSIDLGVPDFSKLMYGDDDN